MRFITNKKRSNNRSNSKSPSSLGRRLERAGVLNAREGRLLYDSVPRLDNIPPTELDRSSRVLYGAGRLGIFSANLLPNYFDAVTDKSHESLRLFPADVIKSKISIEDLKSKHRDSVCFIAITKVRLAPLVSMLSNIGVNASYHVYELLKIKTLGEFNNSWHLKNDISHFFSKIQEVLYILEDDNSRRHYISFLNWHLESLDSYDELSSPYISKDYAVDYFQGLPCVSMSRSGLKILDGGSSDGSFTKNVTAYFQGRQKTVYQFDPRKVSSSSDLTSVYSDELITSYHFDSALSNHSGMSSFDSSFDMASRLSAKGQDVVPTTKLDDLNEEFDILKLHLEGGELKALNGSIKTLQMEPKLVFVTVYHNEDGIFEIQKFIFSILGNRYRYYFHNHGYSGVASIFKAVRKN